MAIRRKRHSRSSSPYDLGYREGSFEGRSDGRWQGQCEAVMQAAAAVSVPKRPHHILYVTSGKGAPYDSLDTGIGAALTATAERVTIMRPQDPVVPVALAERPNLVLVLDGTQFGAEHVQLLRMHGIRTAIWLTDDPYYTNFTAGYAPHYDYVFTPEKNCVPFYRQMGAAQVFNLPLGIHPEAFRPRNARRELRGDISFIGSAYRNRLAMMQSLLPAISHRKLHVSGFWWEQLELPSGFRGTFDPGRWMDPLETAEHYSASRISINIHRMADDERNESDIIIPAVSPNPRTFEISACGTLQLVDAREDIASYYVPNEEIVIFDGVDDLVGKLEHYLTHEEERREIAWRALVRTMRDHTFTSRVSQLLDSVQLA